MKYQLSDIFEGDYPISQKYGVNVTYYMQFGLDGHEGVDYATPTGVDVYCPFEEGVVLRDNDDFKNNAYGNFIVVWDPIQKCAVWYCHLSVNSVKYGDIVKRGAILGKTGNSGNSSGPHLHVNFVETDEKGNRLNKNNGREGFLNVIDAQLVKWISINTPPGSNTNSPSNPMNDNIVKKSYFLDLLAPVKYGLNFNSDSLTEDQVRDWIAEYISERIRAGEWEKLCRYYDFTDSSAVTFEQVRDKIEKTINAYKGQVSSAQAQVSESERRLAVATQEIENRNEQVGRLKEDMTKQKESYEAQIKAIYDSIPNNDKVVADLKAERDHYYSKYTAEAKEKGAALNELAEVEKSLELCENGGKPTQSLWDFLINLFKNTKVQ